MRKRPLQPWQGRRKSRRSSAARSEASARVTAQQQQQQRACEGQGVPGTGHGICVDAHMQKELVPNVLQIWGEAARGGGRVCEGERDEPRPSPARQPPVNQPPPP